MLMPRQTLPDGAIFYPESEGQLRPERDNSRLLPVIATLAANLEALFTERPEVLVARNQLWYPVEGEPETREAPDVSIVFGRPKGERSAYRQWQDGNVPVTVIFDVVPRWVSAGHCFGALRFYEDHGVEEYYVCIPDANRILGYTRSDDSLNHVRRMDGFVSPRLGIRFDLSGQQVVIRYPHGQPFLTTEQLAAVQRPVTGRASRLDELTRRVLLREATPEEARELQQLRELPPTCP
jgi:hypothetical protein